MVVYLAEAWRDYSETKYVCVARGTFPSRECAEKFLLNKCQDFQKITEIKCDP